jgi:hypothetical protein
MANSYHSLLLCPTVPPSHCPAKYVALSFTVSHCITTMTNTCHSLLLCPTVPSSHHHNKYMTITLIVSIFPTCALSIASMQSDTQKKCLWCFKVNLIKSITTSMTCCAIKGSKLLFCCVETVFRTICAADYFSVLYWVRVSTFCFQLNHIYPNDMSKIRFDPWIQSVETTLNQQFNFCSKILISWVSIFHECPIYQIYRAATGLSNEPYQSLIRPQIT